MSGGTERPAGYHRMTKEEFITAMIRDAEKRRGELVEERKDEAETDERERIKRQEREINAYKTSTISRYMHKAHRRDRKAKIRGFV